MAKAHVFHVSQFDAFWRLTPQQMVEFLDRGIAGEEYNLEDYPRIKKPRHILKCRDSGGYESSRSNFFNMPCDWDEEEWKYHREFVREEYGI